MVKEIKSQEEFDQIMKSRLANNVEWCPHCGRAYLIDYTNEEIEAMFKWGERKMLIQDALPNRTPNEREIIRYAWNGSPMFACCEECMREQYGENRDGNAE